MLNMLNSMSVAIRRKIQALRDTSSRLSSLAKQRIPLPDSTHLDQVKRYDEWLNKKASELSSYANKFEREMSSISPNEVASFEKAFNLQYLQIQQKIQHENRQFTMISNIMKNKHDTAKNAINNIR